MGENEKSDTSFVSFTPKISKPEIQQVVFNATKDNPKGINLGLDYTYIPVIPKENEFTIDADKLSFKQVGKAENEMKKETEFEKLRQKAIEKISKIKLKKDSETEEEESSSYDSSYEENESNENSEANSLKEKSDDKSDLNSQLEQMVDKEKSNSQIENNEQTKELEKLETHKGEVKPHEHHSSKHNKDDDYYHVDATKITLFVYNYSTGFVQALKEPKFKISKVVDQINKEKEKLSNLNSKFIANPKLAKEKKRANVSTKQIMDDDELDAYSKKKIKLKEI